MLVILPLDVYLNHVDMRQVRERIVQPCGLRLEFQYIVPIVLEVFRSRQMGEKDGEVSYISSDIDDDMPLFYVILQILC